MKEQCITEMNEEAIAAAATVSTNELLGARSVRNGDTCSSLRGTWAYRVGLVGKPSSGKSTLFNALTRAEPGCGASVSARPFTTIDPNVATGYWRAPHGTEPAHVLSSRSQTAHGRAYDGRRLLPCTVIDVAGLVPGAYTGRGKGNQFLADLTTADGKEASAPGPKYAPRTLTSDAARIFTCLRISFFPSLPPQCSYMWLTLAAEQMKGEI